MRIVTIPIRLRSAAGPWLCAAAVAILSVSPALAGIPGIPDDPPPRTACEKACWHDEVVCKAHCGGDEACLAACDTTYDICIWRCDEGPGQKPPPSDDPVGDDG